MPTECIFRGNPTVQDHIPHCTLCKFGQEGGYKTFQVVFHGVGASVVNDYPNG